MKRLFNDFIHDFTPIYSIKRFVFAIVNTYKANYTPNKSRTHRNYYVLNKNPHIIITSEDIVDIQLFSEEIGKDKNASFVLLLWWTTLDKPFTINHITDNFFYHQKNYPNHDITLICNTKQEFDIFQSRGVKCIYINQNALVDASIFNVDTKIEKTHDVVYNGRLELTKRHYLLEKCKSISLVSAIVHNVDESKKDYLDYLKSKIPNAQILNFNPFRKLKDYTFTESIPQLTPKEISDYYNIHKVGVILSDKEGACYASVEYLLSGLPVVSTVSIGGRDVFLDNRFCRTVKSTSNAVYNAVEELRSLNISPEFVRQETIKSFQPHVLEFKKMLQGIYTKHNILIEDFDQHWKTIYKNKMIEYANIFPVNINND